MKDRRWLFGGLLLAGSVGLAAAATRRRLLREETRLLLIGDSLAQGLLPHMRTLAGEEGISAFDGRGIVGSRIDQWSRSAWLDEALGTFQPTLVLISLGTNDEATSPGAVEREADDLALLISKVEATGAAVAWIGPPALPFPRQGVSDLIRQSVRYYFPSEELEIPRAPDGLHPNVSGYAGWAGAIWSWLL